MQIVLLHEPYNWGSYSIVRAMYEILKEREDVELLQVGEIERMSPGGHVWCYSSQIGLQIASYKEIIARGLKVVNFGLSDPNMFNEGRLVCCDVFCTNDLNTYRELLVGSKHQVHVYHFPVGVDLTKFVKTDVEKDTDMLFIGSLNHGYIPKRKKYIMNLKDMDGFKGYGRGFERFLDGPGLVNAYNHAHLNLEICTKVSSLGSRIFQAAACGVPTLMLKRDDVLECFDDEYEVLTYEGGYDELKLAIHTALSDKDHLALIGRTAQKRCIKDHGMRKRVDDLIKYLGETDG